MSQDLQGKLIGWTTVHRRSGGGKVMRDVSLADRHLYHMLPWPYAVKIFEDRRFRLSPVRCWDDPYEKWWWNILFNRTGALAGFEAYRLCWTTGTYDEPRWRMAAFGKKHDIVRIRCRVGNILEAGRRLIEDHPASLFLGSVRYRPQKTLVQLARSVAAGSRKEVPSTAATMLVHKRSAFRFEHEVRLLWLDRGAPRHAAFVDIDPGAIDHFMTGPYTPNAHHKKIAAAFFPYGVSAKRSGILQAPAKP